VKKIHSRGLVLSALVVVMTPILDVRQSLAQSSGGSSSSGASSGSSGSTSGTGTSPGVAGVPSAGGTAPVGRATAPSAVPTTPGQPGVGVTQPNPSGTPAGSDSTGTMAAPGTLPSTGTGISAGTGSSTGTGSTSSSDSATNNSTQPTITQPQSLNANPSGAAPSTVTGTGTGTVTGTGVAAPAQPQIQQLPPSSGGTARTGDNRVGAAGKNIEECMGTWDAGTHMTKKEWRATCERSLSQSPTILIPELPPDTAVR
jgi:hypothetical protein